MPLRISASIEGQKQINARMSRMIRGVSNFSEPLQKSAQYMDQEIQKQFNQSGGRFGYGKWPELSDEYGAKKSRDYPGTGILVKTGKMRNSFQTFVSASRAIISNTASYFKYHQSNKPRRKIPRRVMMSIGTRQQKQIYRFFTQYLNKLRNG